MERKFLLLLAALLWAVVGIMLCNLAAGWLTGPTSHNSLIFGLTGIILALFIYHFGFLKLVKKNSARILEQDNKLCIFAFQPWRSYVIVVIMIGMGFALRHSPLPKRYLSIIYTGFGLAMILSSIKYIWIYLHHQGKTG